MTTDADRGPNKQRALPSARDIAYEVARIGREHGINPTKVLVFGSYAKGTPTPTSDADVVVVSPDFDTGDVHDRRYFWDWDWNYDAYPGLDIIPLTPAEFEKFASRDNHIVATAVETGELFQFPASVTA